MSAPSKAEVIAALSRLPTLQLRRVFFEGLNNPLWVKPLMQAGAFDHPPAPVVDEQGYIRETFWPEIDYLTRMAGEVPGDVVNVLRRLTASENSWVRRAAFEIARSIPVDQAARLKDLIQAWNPNFGWRTDPRDLTTLARNFLEGGQQRFGVSFANMLFRPRSRGEDSRDPLVTLEEYWYTDALPGIVDALGPSALTVVMPWLEKWEELNKHYSDTSDLSSMSRSDIGNRHDHYPDPEQALIEAVRDIAIGDMAKSPAATAELFLARPMTLLRKIALYATARAIESIQGTPSEELLTAGLSLLADPLSADGQCRIEFADLFALLRDHQLPVDEILQQILGAGSLGSRELLIESLQQRNEPGADLEQLADEHEDRWRQRLLATIGAEHLPQALADQLRDFDERTGTIEFPRDQDFKFKTWTGPTSPSTIEELRELDPVELADHLESWHPNAAWMTPSHEGMGRVLSELITVKPEAFDGVPELATRLRPTYLRALLQGWSAALKTDHPFDWVQVLAVAGGVLSHADETTIPVEGRDIDEDADFTMAKQAAISLLTDAARPNAKRSVPTEVSDEVARLLIKSSSDETAWERYSAKEPNDGADPLNVSLNWQWPIMVRGLVNLVGHGPDTRWFANATRALEHQLERDDWIGASYAVVGEGLARLFNGAPDWLNDHIADLFGTENGLTRAQQVALTTSLATHHMHSTLFNVLRGPLTGAMHLEQPIAMGWESNSSGPELIGHWIITSVIWGDTPLDDPLVEAFFTVLSAEVRGAALGHIAWSFLHSEKVDPDIRARFEQLWDTRVAHVRDVPEDSAELKDFFWIVRSEKFDPQWWLPRLREAAELNPTLNTRGMIGEQLAASAILSPRDALDALRLLMDRADETGVSSYDLGEHAVAPVIAVALDAGDATLAKEATDLMNHLGAKGLVNLEQQVNALRAS